MGEIKNRKLQTQITDKCDHIETETDPVAFKKKSGYKIFGITFAPMNLPFERRIQTFAVFFWMLTFLITGPLSILVMLVLFCSPLFFLPLLYIPWYYYDRQTPNKGGRNWTWMRSLSLWTHFANYFPIRLVKTVDLDPSQNYLFCCHPHGVLSVGVIGCFGTEGNQVSKVFPGLDFRLMTLESNFSLLMPIFREYILAAGMVSVSKESLKYILSYRGGGKAGVIVPGGAPEALDSHPGSYIFRIKKRKGFVKVALRHGGTLVPVISFGETDIYEQISNPEGSLLRRIQDAIQQKINVAPVFFFGRGVFQYSFGLVPKRKPITTVVGEPLKLPKIAEPTSDDVSKWHDIYVGKLTLLFEAHKDKYTKPDAKLILV